MTITLPSGWGPATIITVLYALLVVVAGVIEVAQGDMSLAEYMGTDQVQWLAIATGALGIGRGAAYIGGDPSFAKKGEGVNR